MKKFCRAVAVLFSVLPATTAFGQAVTFTWPLTTNTSGTAVPAGNIAAPEIIAGSPCTAMVQGYIGGGVGQKLWNGTTGWLPETAFNPNRCIQFNATPAPGTQLTVTNVTFLYGFSGIGSQMRSNVFYSVGGGSWTPISGNPLVYGVQSMVQSNTPLSVPVPAGQTFSVRIFPWSLLHGITMTPWFAVHRSVTISAISSPSTGGGPSNRLDIYKKVNANVATPGIYKFNVTCAPLPFTGTNPVNVVYPNPGMTTVNVPAGETCNVTEVQPTTGSWSTPSFAASAGLNVTGSGWGAAVGPVNANGKLFVTNNPAAKTVSFNIRKVPATGSLPAGTYSFTVTCNGPTAPFSANVSVVYPTPGFAAVTGVPSGDICNVAENHVAPVTSTWLAPDFAGSGVGNVAMGAPWTAKVGPVTTSGGEVKVSNKPH